MVVDAKELTLQMHWNKKRLRTKQGLGWTVLNFSVTIDFLVMENEFHWRAGYITETIALAFAAGCVPLYFGWEGVFEIFNPRSFIFYDINNPKSAFEKVAYLEANQSAYQEMLAEPIFKDGNRTINRWFSLSDDIGDGSLKKKIRKTLMLDSSFESSFESQI